MSFPIVLRRGKFFVSSILQHKISVFRLIFQIGISKIFIGWMGQWDVKEKATSMRLKSLSFVAHSRIELLFQV